MKPKAFIFDLDGVITDTAEYHYRAWKTLADEIGVAFDKTINEQLKGVSRMVSLDIILKHGGKLTEYSDIQKEALATKKNNLYKKLINEITPADILPGIMKLLADLKSDMIFIGMASASKNAFTVVDHLGIRDMFDYIADASLIHHSKPAPDVFLDVMNHFNLKPTDCIGVEDAAAGIKAIHAAGMISIGIGGEELSEASIRYKSTNELNCSEILELLEKME
ncbi:MAG: beta-phosphoglucomutase [Vallitaleaceae bacterium]|jgi:beta-phosphoglucomutase|nr:beta-phosphoglucomutase [Vallitaleaceae bacterium]